MSAIAPPVEVASSRSRSVNFGPADWAFVALLLLGAVIVLVETRGMGFFSDDWDFIVARRGISAHTLLSPHGPHLSLLPILIYKLLLKAFGGGSYLPFRFLASFDIVIVGLAIGVACRDRWGRWWGLAPVFLFVTLGPAAESLLWSFQVGYALAIAFGLFSLIALDRGGRWADAIACVSLILSLGSGSQGIGFVVGAAFLVVVSGNWRRRLWVVLAPAVLYLAWYATWGHQNSETHLSLWSTSLAYGMQSLSATAAAVLGLTGTSAQTGAVDMTFGVPIAVALVGCLILAAWRGWRPRPIFWGTAAALVVIWFAASLSDFGAFSRPAAATRYLLTNAALTLVCLCAAVPRPRLARGGVVITVLLLLVIGATNADQFGPQRAAFVSTSQAQRAELGALELMRGTVSPVYDPGVIDPGLANINSTNFFSAQRAFGLIEDPVTQIARQPETTRENVDRILAPNQLMLAPAPGVASTPGMPKITVLGGDPGRRRGCLIIGAAPLDVSVRAGSIAITSSSQFSTTVTAGRFASSFEYGVGTVDPNSTSKLRIAADRASQLPWRLSLTGTGSRVCPVQ